MGTFPVGTIMEYPKSTPKKWEEHKLKMDFSSVPLIFITISDHFQSIAAVLEFFNLDIDTDSDMTHIIGRRRLPVHSP